MTKKLEKLADEIMGKIGRPLDKWAVAAVLESIGVRDADAVQDFGKEDIFALAEDVYARCRTRKGKLTGARKPKELALKEKLGRFAKFYTQGLFFALPMAGQIFAVLFLGYSLWASLQFSEREGTIVAMGIILSLVVTGGFVQAIGRKGLFYLEQGSYALAKEVCLRFIKAGTLVVIEVGLILYLVNLIWPFFGRTTLVIALMYYFLLSELWLSLAVLYALRERIATLLLTLLGALVVYLTMKLTPWGIFAAHGTGLTIADALIFAWSYRALSRRARRTSTALKLAKLPRVPILTYSVAPYFLYGVLYFGYLFVDRLVGWSAGEFPPPYIIWFRDPYEWGIDIALLSLVLTIAALEYTVNEFTSLIIPVQKRFSAHQIPQHNGFFKRFYFRQLILLLAVAVISALGTRWMAAALGNRPPIVFPMSPGNDVAKDSPAATTGVFDDPVIALTFVWGVIGYSLLAWGLLNAIFLFSLSRPNFILRAIVLALIVNLVVGFALSRAISYEYSVIGLTAGSLTFGVLTTWYAFRVLNRLDYYYYSAY